LPYIRGERGLLWDLQASGAFLGLREEHSAADLARAVYEGVALSLKEIIVAVRGLCVRASEVISGASMTSAGWEQMRADAYGLPLLVPETCDPTALGAALLALVNQGVFGDVTEASTKCCRVAQRLIPNPVRANHYDRVFEVYQAAVTACRPLFPKLSAV
jgi:xylulokinase